MSRENWVPVLRKSANARIWSVLLELPTAGAIERTLTNSKGVALHDQRVTHSPSPCNTAAIGRLVVATGGRHDHQTQRISPHGSGRSRDGSGDAGTRERVRIR